MKRTLSLLPMLCLTIWAVAQDVLPRKVVQETRRVPERSYVLGDSIAVGIDTEKDSIAVAATDSILVVGENGSNVRNVEIKDIRHMITFGHEPGREDTFIIVIHSNYYAGGGDPYSTEGCISQFRKYRVAPHYMIERDGTILKMVDESETAYHAGQSRLPGTNITSLNRYSIGIEIINTREEGPTEAQYESLVALVHNIQSRHNIRYIVRHSDIAPKRKDDPWKFDWDGFYTRISPLP